MTLVRRKSDAGSRFFIRYSTVGTVGTVLYPNIAFKIRDLSVTTSRLQGHTDYCTTARGEMDPLHLDY